VVVLLVDAPAAPNVDRRDELAEALGGTEVVFGGRPGNQPFLGVFDCQIFYSPTTARVCVRIAFEPRQCAYFTQGYRETKVCTSGALAGLLAALLRGSRPYH
jgi:hypothetical protein